MRELRNEAAHSATKFDLFALKERMAKIYNLGPNFADFISKVSLEMLVTNKAEAIKGLLNSSELNYEDFANI